MWKESLWALSGPEQHGGASVHSDVPYSLKWSRNTLLSALQFITVFYCISPHRTEPSQVCSRLLSCCLEGTFQKSCVCPYQSHLSLITHNPRVRVHHKWKIGQREGGSSHHGKVKGHLGSSEPRAQLPPRGRDSHTPPASENERESFSHTHTNKTCVLNEQNRSVWLEFIVMAS